MSLGRFLFLSACWVPVLLLAGSPLGAVPGFFVGISIAFFVMPILLILGVPEAAFAPVLWTLFGLYVALVVFLGGQGGLLWLRGDRPEARVVWFWAISLVAVAVTLKLWAGALQQAWP